MIKSICIITSKYPNKFDPAALIFVQQLVWEIADMGIECTVICPIAINIEVSKGFNLPYENIDVTPNGSKIKVYYPKYFGFGQRNFKIFNTARFNLISFHNAIYRTIKKHNIKPSAIYGHFISPSGVSAARIGKKLNIPCFIAYGESSPWSIYNLGLEFVKKEIKDVSGIISVSTKNKKELLDLEIIHENKIKVFPNAVRLNHFYPRDKNTSRRKFELPEDKFIISFVGHFIERKGIDKVIKAIENLEDVYGIFAGKGPITPYGKNVLFTGVVNHEDLPYFYSSSDIFVLPTLNEGCCNAIIESIACGTPVISSNLSFNDEILDDKCSIRIDPTNTEELICAINELKSNKIKLNELRKGCLEKSNKLSISNRAHNIVNFISDNI